MADTVKMPEDEFEALLCIHQAVGRASAYEGLASYFAKQAGDLYARRRDDLASYLRDVVVSTTMITALRRCLTAAQRSGRWDERVPHRLPT